MSAHGRQYTPDEAGCAGYPSEDYAGFPAHAGAGMPRAHDGNSVIDFNGALLLADDLIEVLNNRARLYGHITGIVRDDDELFLLHADGTETRIFGFVEVWDIRPTPPLIEMHPFVDWEPA